MKIDYKKNIYRNFQKLKITAEDNLVNLTYCRLNS